MKKIIFVIITVLLLLFLAVHAQEIPVFSTPDDDDTGGGDPPAGGSGGDDDQQLTFITDEPEGDLTEEQADAFTQAVLGQQQGTPDEPSQEDLEADEDMRDRFGYLKLQSRKSSNRPP